MYLLRLFMGPNVDPYHETVSVFDENKTKKYDNLSSKMYQVRALI